MRAYCIFGPDNDSYAFCDQPRLTKNQRMHQAIVPDFSGTSRHGLRRCSACGGLLAKWDEPLRGLTLRKRKYDISETYDGVTVVSERFKSVYAVSGLSGLSFRQLANDAEFFAVQAVRIVLFDSERRSTRFLAFCSTCKRYASVIGATPAYIKAGCAVAANEFVRTDLEFGSGDEKGPLLICGGHAAEVLRHEKLKGVDLHVVVIGNDPE